MVVKHDTITFTKHGAYLFLRNLKIFKLDNQYIMEKKEAMVI